MGRAPCCDKANVKRGPWSPEEDTALKNYVERNGTGGNWIALPHKAGLKRCGKSCRLRWLNYLRPDIKHGGFTEEEDNVICTLYKNIGSRWSVIASHLPGRTDNDVKNYWNTKLKKKLLAGNTNFDTNSINNNHVKLKSSSFSSSSSTIVVKDEIPGYIFSGFADSNSQKENSTMRTMEVGYGYNVDSQKFTSEPISFPSTALQNNTGITLTGNGYSGMSISPSDEVSSLAFPLDNSYISWSGNRDRDDEAFLVDFSNGSCFDLLNGYVYQEKLGDPALNFSPNYNYLLTNSDSSLFQSVTY